MNEVEANIQAYTYICRLNSDHSFMKLGQKLIISLMRKRLRWISMFSKRSAAKHAFKIFTTPFRKSKRPLPPVFSEAEKLTLDFQGHKVVGYRWNKGGIKKLQILHGFESSVVKFDHFIKPFLRKNYEIIAVDAPAHGRSSGKRLNLVEYIDFIRFIDHTLGPVDYYIAHSFGGLALAHYLETLPESAQRKAVLIAPATETTTAIALFFHFFRLPYAVRIEFDKLIEERAGVKPEHFSICRAAAGFKTPVLWVHDTEDKVTPIDDVYEVQQEGHRHISYFITSGLGHRRIYRDNKVRKAVIDFL